MCNLCCWAIQKKAELIWIELPGQCTQAMLHQHYFSLSHSHTWGKAKNNKKAFIYITGMCAVCSHLNTITQWGRWQIISAIHSADLWPSHWLFPSHWLVSQTQWVSHGDHGAGQWGELSRCSVQTGRVEERVDRPSSSLTSSPFPAIHSFFFLPRYLTSTHSVSVFVSSTSSCWLSHMHTLQNMLLLKEILGRELQSNPEQVIK